MKKAVYGILLAAAFSACGKSDSPAPGDAGTQDVMINFKAKVLGQAFSCSQTYTGIGNNPDDSKKVFKPKDLRFYVHNVRLLDASGQDVAVTLTDDGKWQSNGVALLDFEDGTGTCTNGNAPTNTMLMGKVPNGTYQGLKFTVGVPFALNHLLADNQPSPLNLSALFWSWTGGYRFMRIEGTDAAGAPLAGGLLHLGSTGCTANDPNDGNKGVSSCSSGNRPEISVASFDPVTKAVVIDIGALFKDTDLVTNTTGTATGCMSAPNDPECVPMFPKLGLALGTNPAGSGQTIFTAE